jgi:3-phenylpropionate/trans-cinnamate dioxygenase ferredoxin subunit
MNAKVRAPTPDLRVGDSLAEKPESSSSLRKTRSAMNQPVARRSEIPPGSTKRVDVAGEAVLVCNVDGAFYAIEDVCTHDGAALDQGELEGCRIMCPRHGAFFDVTTGAALTLPAVVPVRTYAVRVAGDDIFVEG